MQKFFFRDYNNDAQRAFVSITSIASLALITSILIVIFVFKCDGTEE